MPLPYVPPQGIGLGKQPVRVDRVVLTEPTTEIVLGPYPWGSVIRIYGNLLIEMDYGLLINADRGPYYYYFYDGYVTGGQNLTPNYGVGLWGTLNPIFSLVPGVWLGTSLPLPGPSGFTATLWPCRFTEYGETRDAYCFEVISWVEGYLQGIGYEYILFRQYGFYSPLSHPDTVMVNIIEYPFGAPLPQFQPGSEVVVEVLE